VTYRVFRDSRKWTAATHCDQRLSSNTHQVSEKPQEISSWFIRSAIPGCGWHFLALCFFLSRRFRSGAWPPSSPAHPGRGRRHLHEIKVLTSAGISALWRRTAPGRQQAVALRIRGQGRNSSAPASRCSAAQRLRGRLRPFSDDSYDENKDHRPNERGNQIAEPTAAERDTD
jgi:hypothetical protein